MEKQKKKKRPVSQIIGIISVVCGFIFSGWFGWHGRSVFHEAEALAESIGKAQKAYYAKHNTFYHIGETPRSFDSVLNVDARNNKYFKLFSGTAEKDTFTLRLDGDKDKVLAQDSYAIINGNLDSLTSTEYYSKGDGYTFKLNY